MAQQADTSKAELNNPAKKTALPKKEVITSTEPKLVDAARKIFEIDRRAIQAKVTAVRPIELTKEDGVVTRRIQKVGIGEFVGQRSPLVLGDRDSKGLTEHETTDKIVRQIATDLCTLPGHPLKITAKYALAVTFAEPGKYPGVPRGPQEQQITVTCDTKVKK